MTITEADGNGTFIAEHTYVTHPPGEASGPFTIVATATDKDGGQGSAQTAVVVSNVAPTITGLAVNPGIINEGCDTTLSGTVIDPVPEPHTVSIVWGDGSTGTVPLAAGVDTFSVQHEYLNNPTGIPTGGAFDIAATAIGDVGASGSADTQVVVNNVAPVITSLTNNAATAGVVQPGGTVTVTGTFTDPGLLDTHVLLIAWGDSSKQSTASVTPGSRSFSVSHVFTAIGTFHIAVQVEDNDGGISPLVLTTATVGNPVPITFPPSPTPVPIGGITPISIAGVGAAPAVINTTTIQPLAAPQLVVPAGGPVPVSIGSVVNIGSVVRIAASDAFSTPAVATVDPDHVIALVRATSIVLSTQVEPAPAQPTRRSAIAVRRQDQRTCRSRRGRTREKIPSHKTTARTPRCPSGLCR